MAKGGGIAAILLASLLHSFAYRLKEKSHEIGPRGDEPNHANVSFDFMTKTLDHSKDVAKGSKCRGVARDQTYYAASFGYWFTDIKGNNLWPEPAVFDAGGKSISAAKTYSGKCVIYEMCHNNANNAHDFEHTLPKPRIVELPADCKLDSQIQQDCIDSYLKGSNEANESMCFGLQARLKDAQDALKENRRHVSELRKKTQHARRTSEEKEGDYTSKKKMAQDLGLPDSFQAGLNKTLDEYLVQGEQCHNPVAMTCLQRIDVCRDRRAKKDCHTKRLTQYACCSELNMLQGSCCEARCHAASACKVAAKARQEYEHIKESNDKRIQVLETEAASLQEAVENALSAWTLEHEHTCDRVFTTMWNEVVKCVKSKLAVSCDEACLLTSSKGGSGVVEGFNPDDFMKVGVKPLYLPPRSWITFPWKDESWQYNS